MRVRRALGKRTLTGGISAAWRSRVSEEAAHAAHAAEPAHGGAHLLLLQFLGAALGFVDGGGYQVLEHLDVLGVHHLGVYPHGGDGALARGGGGDHAGSRAALHRHVAEPFLRLGHLALGLLGFLHELLDVHAVSPTRQRAAWRPARRLVWVSRTWVRRTRHVFMSIR